MKLEEIKNKTKDAVDYLVAVAGVRAQRSAHPIPRRHGPIPHLLLRQHHADCTTEARCHQRCRNSHVELAWPLRQTRRKRHPHSRSHGRQDASTKDVATDEPSEDATTRVSGRCMDSAPCTCSTDYLVICGRASACPMDPPRATLESPSDSSKAHHRSTHLPCAMLLGAGALLNAWQEGYSRTL